MMKLKIKLTILIIIILNGFSVRILKAQLSSGGIPLSYSLALKASDVQVVEITPPDISKLLQEDAVNPVPYRVAVNLPVSINLGDFTKHIKSGDREIYRISVKAPGATGITLYFDHFVIPLNGKLFVYNPTRTRLLGAFTSLNNNKASTFATSLINGDQVTIEYDGMIGSPLPEIHISEIAYAYKNNGETDGIMTGFGASGKCEVNVNCDEGLAWQIQKRGVTRIQVKRGTQTLFCTGSLVNNTLNDGQPYVLTADHCGRLSSDTDISQWIFYFGYEGKNCPKPLTEPYLRSMTGARLISHGGEGGLTGSDFFLVLLDQQIPDTFNVYYNGWSRLETPSSLGVSIHHPQGDIMKISTYKSPLQSTYWPGDTKLAHWRVTWDATFNGHGTTEPGSSGSPLFDSDGRIVGTLTGGDSSCDSAYLTLPDYYGEFFYHWDRNGTDSAQQLKPWLDPTNSNTMAMNGWALSSREISNNHLIRLFPNPAHDFLTISLPSVNGIVKMTLTNLSGLPIRQAETYLSGDHPLIPYDISDLVPGIYFLNLQNQDLSLTGKFIKVRP